MEIKLKKGQTFIEFEEDPLKIVEYEDGKYRAEKGDLVITLNADEITVKNKAKKDRDDFPFNWIECSRGLKKENLEEIFKLIGATHWLKYSELI